MGWPTEATNPHEMVTTVSHSRKAVSSKASLIVILTHRCKRALHGTLVLVPDTNTWKFIYLLGQSIQMSKNDELKCNFLLQPQPWLDGWSPPPCWSCLRLRWSNLNPFRPHSTVFATHPRTMVRVERFETGAVRFIANNVPRMCVFYFQHILPLSKLGKFILGVMIVYCGMDRPSPSRDEDKLVLVLLTWSKSVLCVLMIMRVGNFEVISAWKQSLSWFCQLCYWWADPSLERVYLHLLHWFRKISRIPLYWQIALSILHTLLAFLLLCLFAHWRIVGGSEHAVICETVYNSTFRLFIFPSQEGHRSQTVAWYMYPTSHNTKPQTLTLNNQILMTPSSSWQSYSIDQQRTAWIGTNNFRTWQRLRYCFPSQSCRTHPYWSNRSPRA